MTTAPVPSDAPARREPTVPNRLLAVGDIVGGSFRTLTRSPKVFVGLPLLAGLAIVIPALALFLLAVGGARATGRGGSVVPIAVFAGLILGLVAVYVLARVLAAVTIGAYRIALGEDPSIGQLWRESSGIVWRLILFMVLTSVTIMIAIFLLGFAVFAAASVDSATAGIIFLLASIASLPLMLFLGVKLLYCLPVMAIEHADPVAAIRRSWTLTRGFWWPTLGRVLMLYLIGIPVSLLSQGLTMAPITGLTQSSDTFDTAAVGATFIIALLIAAALSFLYQAFSQIYLTIMYLDARRREHVAATPPGSYPYAGGPAYQQTPPAAGAPPAPGATSMGPAAGTWAGSGPYPEQSATGAGYPQPPDYPTTHAGDPYPPAGPLWSHPSSSATEHPDDPGTSGAGRDSTTSD